MYSSMGQEMEAGQVEINMGGMVDKGKCRQEYEFSKQTIAKVATLDIAFTISSGVGDDLDAGA